MTIWLSILSATTVMLAMALAGQSIKLAALQQIVLAMHLSTGKTSDELATAMTNHIKANK
jgi:hypothetical protein